MPTITGVHNETQDISGMGKTWIVDEDARISGENYAIFEDSASSGNVLKVFGALTMMAASGAAIGMAGDNARIEIAAGAMLSAGLGNGVAATGENARIVNAGTIDTDDGVGINLDNPLGTGSIVNNGTVIARTGIHIFAEGVSITNAGTINAFEKGIELVAMSLGHQLTNTGRISATSNSGFAVLGSDHDDTVINSGSISGRIFLNDGDDLFDHRRGRLSNAVEGGEGDDTLITRKSSVRLAEQADDGFDTVKSSVSYVLGDNVEKLMLLGKNDLGGTGSAGDDLLYGNRGRNALQGLAGDDFLSGGRGIDTLTGGGDADTFVLSFGSGRDTVTDFIDGVDFLRVIGFGAIEDIENHIRQKGDDVVIAMNDRDVLVLKGIDVSLVDSNDFSSLT